MSESEIRHAIDRMLDQLRAKLVEQARETARFEALADAYWRQICVLTHERDAVQIKLNAIEALACPHPACQLCQVQ